MKKIIININETDGIIELDNSDVVGSISDQNMCAVLIGAYIITATSVIKNHECSDPDCCVKSFNQEIVDAIEETMKLHNLSHRHE